MSRLGISLGLALAVAAAACSPSVTGPAWAQQQAKTMSSATRALFDAVLARDIVAARISLNNGADVDAENDNGQTAADLAVDNGYFDIAHLILSVRSQQRAAARPEEKFSLPPPPPVYPSAPSSGQQAAAAQEPAPHVGPPIRSEPTVRVAEAPMTAPVSKVELPKPVSLFRPPRPVPANMARAAPAGQAIPPAERAPSEPAPPPHPPENLWKPEVESAETAAAQPAAPPPVQAPPPAAPPEAPAADSPKATEPPAEPAAAPANPVSEALSSVGGFFARTFNKNADGYSAVETASGGSTDQTGESAGDSGDAAEAPEKSGASSEDVARARDGAKATPEIAAGPTLKGVRLTLDGVNGLGRAFDPAEKENCIARRRQTVFFCLEPAHWPKDLAAAFDVTTQIYQGDKAIVRYDGGAATRMYALFPTTSFAKVALSLQQRYGAPSQRLTQRRAIISSHSRINVVLRWISEDPASGAQTVLEVRKIDDLRGMIPDTRTGVIRLFRPGSEEIFKYLSETDFVLHRVRENSEHRFSKK